MADYLNKITLASRVLLSIINNILNISAIENEKLHFALNFGLLNNKLRIRTPRWNNATSFIDRSSPLRRISCNF